VEQLRVPERVRQLRRGPRDQAEQHNGQEAERPQRLLKYKRVLD
jgi:hypothetical protein